MEFVSTDPADNAPRLVVVSGLQEVALRSA